MFNFAERSARIKGREIMSKTLEDAVAATAATVADWRTKIAKIDAQIAAENHAITIATKQREEHALAATLGDAVAITEIRKARSSQHESEQRAADLSIALPAAKNQLAAAEKVAAAARAELAKFHVEKLQRERIDVAGEIDEVTRNFARLYRKYEELGGQIINMPDALPPNMHGITNHEAALGARRVRASLPAFFWKLFPGSLHDEMKTENLATSETRFWNLPPESPEKAKAA
jgi:hypothetical protein